MAGFTDGTGNSGSVVDFSMIPQSLISRVDVERDGAGPTYGSDAVAGVVNFILDDLPEARGTFGSPIWSGTVTPTYRLGQFAVAWMARFASAMTDPGIPTAFIPINNPLGYSGSPTYFVSDLTVRWQGGGFASPYVMIGINNALDKDPPVTTGSIGTHMFNTQPVIDVVGRYFFLNVGVKI